MKKIAASVDSNILIPEFALPSTEGGRMLGTRDFRQQYNLIILFLHEWSCENCRGLLYSLRDHQDMFMWMDARVLAVIEQPLGELTGAAADIGPGITLLADNDGGVTAAFSEIEKYGGAAAAPQVTAAVNSRNQPPFIIITDRYGSMFMKMEMEEGEAIDFNEVESTLMFIATQCPECGRPEGDTLPGG